MTVSNRKPGGGEEQSTSEQLIGTIEQLHRYPVKSMRGEQLEAAFVGYSGIYGDRIYAFTKSGGPAFFPYFTGRDKQQMLLYTPRFRNSEHARQPHYWAEAEAYSIGISPLFATEEELVVDVETPEGEVLGIDDPALIARLGEQDRTKLTLCRSDRALTDGRPISLISSQTVAQLSKELDKSIDSRRFRANISVDLAGKSGFSEDAYLGCTLRLGERVQIVIVERDPRCEMITFDPNTGAADPAILRQLSLAHERLAGVYAAVLVEGMVRPGDPIYLIE